MKLSDYVIDFLVNQGIFHIFELIGGAITHLVDSTYDRDDITCVSVHHEQAAAFAAEAYARINGKLGVAMATSGPGALNLLTGIGSCYFDSIPCLFITGQVNTYEYKFNKPIRQIGFQETDIVSVARPIAKFAALVDDEKKIRYYLEKSVYLAQSGRPGPVLLDIPMNIQRSQIEPDNLESFFDSQEFKEMANFDQKTGAVDKVISLMKNSKRPVILAGGGIRCAKATEDFLSLANMTGIPVGTSLMGLDSIPHNHSSFLGMIGTYGNRCSNFTLANSDFLLVLGSRLDTRQTGTLPETFARGAKKVHVDIDSNELNSKIKADVTVNCHLKEFLNEMISKIGITGMPDTSEWYKVIDNYREFFLGSQTNEDDNNPNHFIKHLSLHSRKGDIICLDVGQHQIWAANSFNLKEKQRMLISGGMGAMGFAASIGATMAAPGQRVIAIVGDGGIQVNIQELDVIAARKLPIKIFVINNHCLGMVRQFQDMYFSGRRQSTIVGYSCPDLNKIAEAYGIPSFLINSRQSTDSIMTEALRINGPALVNVEFDQATFVDPKLLVNKPIEDMSPYINTEELKKLMIVDMLKE